MPCIAVCTSHSPLLNVPGAAPVAVEREIREHTLRLAAHVRDFAPDLVVQFGDDHASAFNLSLMPSFCVGLRAAALGDFETSRGPIRVDEATGRRCVEYLHGAGVDVAFSYRMTVDHGFVQALDLLLGGIDRVPVIPVMINCGGELRPPMARVGALGDAIGRFVAGLDGRRVLLLGSGGLSHDPPLPEFVDAPPDVQQRAIDGVVYTPELLRERTARVHRAAQDFATENRGALLPLDESWDREFLSLVEHNALDRIADFEDAWIRRRGGRGGQEVRNWLAPLAALRAAAGRYVAHVEYYRAVPELICGYGMLRAAPATGVAA